VGYKVESTFYKVHMSSQVSYLQASGYILDTDLKIWLRSEYTGISYSDGEETELHIARIIEQADDISILSTELRQHCIDWPTLYHLSGTRANILRPFATVLTGDILEIGAGCGAITRYLGECGANVSALEGSPRRAAITRSRTRDLQNVTVLAEKFDQFQCEHQFDVITLIGVLEYANLFISSENPALTMLKQVRSLLKSDGKLIIAIENQLGLKYFAGAPEDHLGRPMYGIEGRYRADQPQTFGRAVLTKLLEEAGFPAAEFLAPFPDYKLPVSILTEKGLSSKRFDGAALAWQSARRDPQLPRSTNFSLELAWPEIFKNGLALDMANSFLIIASPLKKQMIKSSVFAYHYSTDRAPQYCKETVFERSDENAIVVNYHMLGNHQYDDRVDGIIHFKCPDKAIYAEGMPLSLEFVKIVAREDWSMEDGGAFIRRYISLLHLIANQRGNLLVTSKLTDKLPGDFFDMVPQNIIVNHNGQPVVIDAEWTLNSDIELGWLLFRALLLAIDSIKCFGMNSGGGKVSRRTFIKSIFHSAGYLLSDEDFSRFVDLESAIQQEVSGCVSEGLLNSWTEQMLPTSSAIESDRQVANVDQILAERDEQVANLSQTMSERDNQIAGLQSQIEDIYASTSWRLTSPIRAAKSTLISARLTKLEAPISSYSSPSNNLLRQVYRILPLPQPVKQQLKQIYLQSSRTWRVRHKEAFQMDPSKEALPLVVASAKQFDPEDRHVLIIDWRIPTPDRDSGSVRMLAILLLLKRMKYRITFISDSEEQLPAYQATLEKENITVLLGFHAARQHLVAEGGKYHFALLSRPEVAFQYLPYVRAYALYSYVIYDTVDLHWVRFEREMQIFNNQALLEASTYFRRVELFNTACADLTLAITDEEKNRLLIEQPDAKIAVLPNIHEIFPPKTPFAQRKGLLFIGGFWHKPNEDAVIYFVKDILPKIIKKIPDLIFYVIGSNMPESIKSLRSANVNLLGFVPDVVPYFESCRVFVAPLRFGAGMKGKVGQSMSHGLPIVTTSIGAEGMDLRHEKHLLVADDTEDFAEYVVRIYRHEALWQRLSTEALAHLQANYSLTVAQKRIARIFARPDESRLNNQIETSII
jgi:glycosyltransferase involved in cell wall biosynthesis/2-polyprenyl-3-methyl-5-hydroxy-6-metoxy-1,4-benzoquinol methylase